MSDQEYKYIGKGIYTILDTARLARISDRNLRNWIHFRGNKTSSLSTGNPIIQPDHGIIDGVFYLSFLDLIEARTIGKLRELGVSLQFIRKAYTKASLEFNSDHPFATNRYYSDGHRIWIELEDETSKKRLFDVLTDQSEFRKISEPFLNSIDFTNDGLSHRWWPIDRRNGIVIDPLRSFGQPVLNSYGIPTIVIADAVKAEKSVNRVADLYEVDQHSVMIAYKYERRETRRLAA